MKLNSKQKVLIAAIYPLMFIAFAGFAVFAGIFYILYALFGMPYQVARATAESFFEDDCADDIADAGPSCIGDYDLDDTHSA